jgi:hypothetical protein
MIQRKILNERLMKVSRNKCHEAKKRIQNWTYAAQPVDRWVQLGEYKTTNEGRYSRSCSYTKFSYDPLYTSFINLNDEFTELEYHFGFSSKEKLLKIKAPKGMIFEIDKMGLLLRRKTDGMDFHLTGDMLERKNFATFVRQEMASNYKLRLDVKKRNKVFERNEKVFQSDLKTTMVTLFDSRKAGNCVEGSLIFAKRFLKIPRQEILNGGFMFKVNGRNLYNSGDERAKNAVKTAWLRETTVCI